MKISESGIAKRGRSHPAAPSRSGLPILEEGWIHHESAYQLETSQTSSDHANTRSASSKVHIKDSYFNRRMFAAVLSLGAKPRS
jgi:hypothetical protein